MAMSDPVDLLLTDIGQLVTLSGPASVSVHDDRDVAGEALEIERLDERVLLRVRGNDFEQVLTGHRCR